MCGCVRVGVSTLDAFATTSLQKYHRYKCNAATRFLRFRRLANRGVCKEVAKRFSQYIQLVQKVCYGCSQTDILFFSCCNHFRRNSERDLNYCSLKITRPCLIREKNNRRTFPTQITYTRGKHSVDYSEHKRPQKK